MPDGWEYPWYAAWDLAFHCLPLAQIDPVFAKRQLLTLLEVWYQHPNGQLPAYEWNFSRRQPAGPCVGGVARLQDRSSRERACGPRASSSASFLKLLLNFTWWVNRKDAEGHNVFQGGFLGLDNIGVFDRSKPLPVAGHLGQADGTAWMGTYCLSMLAISLELAREEPVYEDMATKFFEHFLYIAAALNDIGGKGIPLWNDEDAFFYDVLHFDSGEVLPLRLRSLVGLIPLLAVETIEPDLLERLPDLPPPHELVPDEPERPRVAGCPLRPARHGRAAAAGARARRSDEARCCGGCSTPTSSCPTYGVRSLSRFHRDSPYTLSLGGQEWTVDYEPAESHTARLRRQLELARTRSGSRSTTCSSRRSSASTTSTATTSRSSIPSARAHSERSTRWRPTCRPARVALPARRVTAAARFSVTTRPRRTRSGATGSCSTNTSTATPARALARRTRPAGRRSWPSSWSRRRRPNVSDERLLHVRG